MTIVSNDGERTSRLVLEGAGDRLLTSISARAEPRKSESEAEEAAAAVPAPSRIFSDHWWDDRHWNYLREAGRYHAELDKIKLVDPPTGPKVRAELDDILDKQKPANLNSRIPAIVEQAGSLPLFLERIVMADALRNKFTQAVIALAVSFPRPAIMHFKHRYKRPRPMQLEPKIRPVVDCPFHAAYPSGHSTQLHLVANVVAEVTGDSQIAAAFLQIAKEVAENREYAGLHYSSDSAAGAELARQLVPLFRSENAVAFELARREWN